MKELLTELTYIYLQTGNSYRGDDGREYFKDDDYNAHMASCLCDEYLITENGTPKLDNINKLRHYGYRVFPGEKDGFGWLTGCVQKNNDTRILVFG